MSAIDFPDWNRAVIVNNDVTTPVKVTVLPNPGPPAPGPPPAGYDPEPFAWAAGVASGTIIDLTGYNKPIYWTFSNPEGQAGVWLMYLDTPAVAGKGIYVPSPGFLVEYTWMGLVSGITAAGVAAGGGMVMSVGP